MINSVIEKNPLLQILSICLLMMVNTVSAEIRKSPPSGNFQSPPAKKYEQKGERPAWNYVWVDGYWNWLSNTWKWQPGKYVEVVEEKPPVNNPDYRSMPPSQEHIWVPGQWVFEAGDWSWHKGHYIQKPFRNAFWHAGYWRYQAPGWVWVDGHW